MYYIFIFSCFISHVINSLGDKVTDGGSPGSILALLTLHVLTKKLAP